MEQHIPYSLICDLFSRNLETYLNVVVEKCSCWKIWCWKICFGKFGVGKFVLENSVSENLLSEKSPDTDGNYIVILFHFPHSLGENNFHVIVILFDSPHGKKGTKLGIYPNIYIYISINMFIIR